MIISVNREDTVNFEEFDKQSGASGASIFGISLQSQVWELKRNRWSFRKLWWYNHRNTKSKKEFPFFFFFFCSVLKYVINSNLSFRISMQCFWILNLWIRHPFRSVCRNDVCSNLLKGIGWSRLHQAIISIGKNISDMPQWLIKYHAEMHKNQCHWFLMTAKISRKKN